MNMFYAVLACVMAVFNLSRGLNGMNAMNLTMGVLWLVIGIVFAWKHVKELKKAKKREELRQREETNG